jgi:hypothetical protein
MAAKRKPHFNSNPPLGISRKKVIAVVRNCRPIRQRTRHSMSSGGYQWLSDDWRGEERMYQVAIRQNFFLGRIVLRPG